MDDRDKSGPNESEFATPPGLSPPDSQPTYLQYESLPMSQWPPPPSPEAASEPEGPRPGPPPRIWNAPLFTLIHPAFLVVPALALLLACVLIIVLGSEENLMVAVFAGFFALVLIVNSIYLAGKRYKAIRYQKLAETGQEAIGVVTWRYSSLNAEGGTRRNTIKYSFPVGGSLTEGKSEWRTGLLQDKNMLPVGSKVWVLYDPENVRDSMEWPPRL